MFRSDPLEMPTNLNVLVVGNEPNLLGDLSRWLGGAGFCCVQAESPAAAWEHLRAGYVQMAILDVLPHDGPSNVELLQEIKDQNPTVEILLLAGTSETETAIDALMFGASTYLRKPVTEGELLFHVQRARERQQLLRECRCSMRHLEKRVREQTETIRNAHEELIHRLITAAMLRDEETGAHIRRSGLYAEVFAAALGWPDEEIERFRMAAPMHDVGKIGIPDSVLRKPGPLSDVEFKIMKSHTTIAADLLSGSNSPVLRLAREIAMHHHEHWDGSGYPFGLAEHAIPEPARIVSIIDVYDALSHDRVYRKALPEHEVLELLERGAGRQFDPVLLSMFFSLLPEMRRIAHEHQDDPTEKQLLQHGYRQSLVGLPLPA